MILIAEDEPKLAALLVDYLNAAGFTTRWVADGAQVIPEIRARAPELLLLDLMLPNRDGLDICRELRTFSALPVIMITARVEEIDRLLGLELGADDYICKPFSPREVVARVKAILRRVQPPALSAGSALQIDEERYAATLDGQALELTPVEFRLLKAMAAAEGKIFTREQLLDHLYEDHRVVNDRTVDTHIKNLRRKLDKVRPEQEVIRSVYGVGYRLLL